MSCWLAGASCRKCCENVLLLQGPTSSGKTSLVAYLAAQTGHPFIRINNHQHTDLQEYLGSWVPDSQGELWKWRLRGSTAGLVAPAAAAACAGRGQCCHDC
jgi:hypothetical protein